MDGYNGVCSLMYKGKSQSLNKQRGILKLYWFIIVLLIIIALVFARFNMESISLKLTFIAAILIGIYFFVTIMLFSKGKIP